MENLRGVALLLDGDGEKALASFEKALTLQPSLQAARYNRALALLRRGDLPKATADLEKIYADETSTLRGDAAYHLGIAHDRLKRPKEAEAWLDRALALDSKLDAALLYVGMLRENRGELQGAGRAYLSYLERYPQSPVALLRFGLAAHKSGRADVAKTYLERAIAAAPRSAEAIEARKFLVMWD